MKELTEWKELFERTNANLMIGAIVAPDDKSCLRMETKLFFQALA